MKKRWLPVLTAVLLLLSVQPVSAAKAYPDPTDRFFVNDYAGVLDEEQERAVYEAGVKLYEATDAQVVLLTVDSLSGKTLEEYGLGVARQWELGDKDKNNGLLLLFTVDGPHSRIEVGRGLEGALPDSKAGRILDTFLVPVYGDRDSWGTALTETYKAMINVVYQEYGMEESQYPLSQELPGDEDGMAALIVLLIVVLVFFLPPLISGKRYSGGPLSWLGWFLLGRNTSRNWYDNDHRGGFGGGGFGGGFGGGGFRGGGGGFGGGGASR